MSTVWQLPVHDGGASCKLDEQGAHQRNLEFADVVERGLTSRERTEDGAVLLTFAKRRGLEDDLRELIRRESQCCGFFTFEVDSSGDEIAIRVEAPAENSDYLDELYRSTRPAQV